MTRVLAFMCTRHRPVLLRHAVLQMSVQTYPVDLAIYINSDEPVSASYTTDYTDLLADLQNINRKNIFVKFGETGHQHTNHFRAIDQIDLENYDLFLKIDDDDIYRRSYVEEVVEDFNTNNWDFSGEHCHGSINGRYWKPDHIVRNMGLEDSEKCCGVSATWAFSLEAIEAIRNVDINTPGFEDRLWKNYLEQRTELKMYLRKNNNYNYHQNIHGENTSTGDWLESNRIPAEQSLITSFQAVRVAVSLLKQAMPHLPADLYRKIISSWKLNR